MNKKNEPNLKSIVIKSIAILATISFIYFLLLASVLVLVLTTSGCTAYKGAKIVEGADLAVGVNVPSTDGTLQLQLLNYLSGFRLGVAQDAALTVEYSVHETNSYLADLIKTDSQKTISASVSPTTEEAGGEQTNFHSANP